MPQFRKRPIVVHAQQFDSVTNPSPYGAVYVSGGGRYVLDTPSGRVQVDDGDWIIDNTATKPGNYYPCKPDVFEAVYEPVE